MNEYNDVRPDCHTRVCGRSRDISRGRCQHHVMPRQTIRARRPCETQSPRPAIDHTGCQCRLLGSRGKKQMLPIKAAQKSPLYCLHLATFCGFPVGWAIPVQHRLTAKGRTVGGNPNQAYCHPKDAMLCLCLSLVSF
jgi:hypothetical protein